MNLATILIILLWVVFLGIVYFLVQKRKNKLIQTFTMRNLGERQNRAILANATVLRSTAGIPGEQGNEARVKLTLTVMSGPTTTYEAKAVWLVDIDALDSVKPGCVVSVKIDILDSAVVFPAVSWARYVGQ